jgi:hypothetical protein
MKDRMFTIKETITYLIRAKTKEEAIKNCQNNEGIYYGSEWR